MGKCNILLYNHKGIPPKRVGWIAVAISVKFLETNLGYCWMCYNTYKKGRVILAEKNGKFGEAAEETVQHFMVANNGWGWEKDME